MKKSNWKKILEKIGFDFREDQYVGAQYIADTFAANSSPDARRMLEAPTGSGKTLMYLGVAYIEKYPLLISTSGKLLQQQIAEFWRSMTGEDAAIVKGRSNYICRNMAEVFRKRLPETHSHFKSLQMLLDYLKEYPERDISLVASALKWTSEFDAFVRSHLLSNSALCLAGRCGEIAESRDLCTYNALLQDASGKQIVITNHHALITITGNNPSGTEQVFSGRKLVVDEAHDLPEVTTSVMTKHIGSTTLHRLMKDLKELFEDATVDNTSALNIGYMVKGVARLLDTMEGISCTDDGYCVFNSLIEVQRLFDDTCSFMEDIRKKIQPVDIGRNAKLSDVKLQNLLHRYDVVCTELNAFIHPKIDNNKPDSPAAQLAFAFNAFSLSHCMDSFEPQWVFYLQYDPETKSRELKRTFLNSCFYLLQLWNFFQNVAFVSATLTLPGKPKDEEFDWMAAQLGLKLSNGVYTYHKLASPFDLRKQCDVFIATPGSMFTKPGDATPEPYLKACIHLTGKLIRAFQGRTLSLYTASQRLQSANWILQLVFKELPVCKLLAQNETADKDELAREFIENHHAALLGTRSFFQGFDAPGETLSCLILEKLPFGYPGDPVRKARCRMVEDQKEFEEVTLPEMLMTLRQAFGRLIRSTRDRGIFILSDPRCIGASYRDAVLSALKLEDGASYHSFSNIEEVLTHKCLKKLPFPLDDASDLDPVFEKHWIEFRKTAQFRRITGINTLEDILEKFGIKQLHPWQEETIDDILNDYVKELLVIYPAGSGKSLTYQIPALLRGQGLTLVVSPLVSLMFDQLEALRVKGFERQCAMLSGGMYEEQKNEVKKRAANGLLRLLYVTPERLAGGFLSFLKEKVPGGVRLMVIDEAHMICEAGPNFRPLYYELSNARELLGRPQLMLVTATAGKAVIGEISQRFRLDPQQVKRESVVRRGVRLKVNMISRVNQHYTSAVDFVKHAEKRPVLIYGLTQRYVHSLQKELKKEFPSLDIRIYDADLTIKERNENHLAFLHNKAQVMIATKAYGMGIDKPDIWGVLFNNLPSSIEEFVQGFGRICRRAELLEKYEQDVHTAVLAEVTFHPKDFDETKQWFIDRPFEKTLDFNQKMIDSFCRTRNNEFEVAMGDESDDFKDAWIGLSFLKSNGYIDDFRFDWDNNRFKLDGIKFDLRNRNRMIQEFERDQEHLKQCKIEALVAMQDFCTSNQLCRNHRLQIHFNETEQPKSCYLCDNCPEQDMDKHRAYIRSVQAEMASLRKVLYRQGIFVGSEEEFQKEFDRILAFDDEKFSAHLGNLERNHNESALFASDCLLLRTLLELHRKYSGKPQWQWREIPELLAEWERLQTTTSKFPTRDGCERARQRIAEWGKRLPSFPLRPDDDLERLKAFYRKVADYPKSPYQPFSSAGAWEDFAAVRELHSDAEFFDKKFGSHREAKIFMTLFGVTPEKPPTMEDIDLLPLQKLHPDQGWIEWSNALLAIWQLRNRSNTFQSTPEMSLKRIADCFAAFDKLPKRIATAVQKSIGLDDGLPEEIILFLTGGDAMRQLLHKILSAPENISTELPQLRKCPVVRGYLMQQRISARNGFMQKNVAAIKDKTLTATALTQICGKSLNYEDFYGFLPRGTEIPDLKSVITFAKLNRSLKAGAENSISRLLEEWLHDLCLRQESGWLLPLYRKCATQKILQEILHDISASLDLVQYYNNADDDALLSLKDFLAEEYPALLNLFAEEISELAGSNPFFHPGTEKNEIKVVNSLSDLGRLFDSCD